MSTRNELDALNEDFASACATRDVGALTRFFAPDCVALSPDSPTRHGGAEIAAGLASGPDDRTARSTAGQILEDRDLVVDIGTWEISTGGAGRYVVVYRRQPDGSLALAVDVILRTETIDAPP